MSEEEPTDDPFADIDGVEVESDPFSDLGDVTPDDDPFEDLSTDSPIEADLSTLLDDGSDDDTSIVPVFDEDIEVVNGEAIVPKRRYCEQCAFFSDPPDVHCSNDGTEIRELVDMKQFRVYRCPVVARRVGIRGYDD